MQLRARVAARIAAGKPAAASYTADIAAGQRRPGHTNLDPKGLLFSGEPRQRTHPESVPVVLVLDQTGSMERRWSGRFSKSLRSIARLLGRKKCRRIRTSVMIAVGGVA